MRTGFAALGAVIAVLATVGGASAAKPSPAAGFTDFTVSATPPNPAGTVCPGSTLCSNGAAEPAIAVSPTGRFFASSENGLGGGTLAWTSGDNGLHYASTPTPNDVSTGSDSVGRESGFEPGGVAPFPQRDVALTLIDRSLFAYDVVWIGAGTAKHMASLPPAELARLAGARMFDPEGDG